MIVAQNYGKTGGPLLKLLVNAWSHINLNFLKSKFATVISMAFLNPILVRVASARLAILE